MSSALDPPSLPLRQATSSLLFETAFLVALRGVFFLVCRHFVNVSLFSDLRSVIREDGYNGVLETPDKNEIALDEVEKGGHFPGRAGAGVGGSSRSTSPGRGAAHGKGRLRSDSTGSGTGGTAGSSLLTINARSGASSSAPPGSSPPPSPGMVKKFSLARQQNYLYPKLSTSLFCLSFSESCMLFTLVLFGEAVGARTRSFNWALSLLTLLSLIIFVIPLGLSLLLTHRTRTTPAPRTIALTLVPFSIYLFLFYRVGSLLASRVVVEGRSLGLINDLLSRVCVPGVFLIASLSGGGAVNTAWQAYEWRSISSAEPVTDAQITSAERSLYRARLDIQQRTRSLALATSSAAREAEATAAQSLFSRWTTSTPAATHRASLEIELKALEGLEGQMMHDVGLLRRRKEMRELGRSFKGRLWLAAGWALSVYCVWRVFVSCINLVFGYSQRHHHVRPVLGEDAEPVSLDETPPGTDLLTSLVGRLVVLLDIDIDVATWSRLIGLVLIGSIILANMRNVLGSVSKIFKVASTGVSTSFMLLFLAQLMGIYLLTSLISLPQSPNETTTSLLDTLPSFDVFSRLFDSVFLIAAGTVFSLRWVERKIRVEESVGGQYS